VGVPYFGFKESAALDAAQRVGKALRISRALTFAGLIAAGCNPSSARPDLGVAPAILLVAPARVSSSGPADGSAERPFATLADAVRAAPPGALVRLDAGDFEGGIVLTRPIVLMGRGPARTRIVPRKDVPGAPILTVQGTGRVELRGLAIEGGAIGLAIEGGQGHLLNDVALRGQAETGLRGRGAGISMRGSEVVDVAMGVAGSGLDLVSGSLILSSCTLRRAGRRAIILQGTRALLEDVDAAGSGLSALQATDGADVRIRGGVFANNGGTALYAGAARLTVDRARIEENEYGVVAFRGARAMVTASTFLDHRVAAVAFVNSSGFVRSSTIVHGGIEGGVFALHTPSPVIIEDTHISEPGTFGVHLTNATAELRGNEIAYAVHDRQQELGDGLYAMESTVSLEANLFHGNQGNGVVLTRSRLTLRDSDLSGNGRAGLSLVDNTTAVASRNLFGKNQQGIALGERSMLTIDGNAFQGNDQFAIDEACGEGAIVREPGARNVYIGHSPHRRACR
jgi:nitrous oxidase accessory protein NosD